MNKLFAAAFASILAASSLCAFGAELTSEQSTELRQRAEGLQADRARMPDPRQDDVKLNQNRSDVRLNQRRSEVKTKTASAKKAKSAKGKPKVKKKRRSLKDIPGALVR